MKKLARNLAAIILALFAANAAHSFTLGVNMASWHDHDGFNNVNPGLYGQLDSGWAGGIYKNSYYRTSVWAGYQFDWKYGGITVGGVTGYSVLPVMPMLLPSVKIPYGFRIGIIPKIFKDQGATALHLSWEYKP